MLALIKKMQSLILVLVIFVSAIFSTGEIPDSVRMPDLKAEKYGQWVDPFIGTGGYPWMSAMLFPGATTPFGMVRLSPDTTLPGGMDFVDFGHAGYYYPYTHLWGFSNTRLSGAGTGNMEHFRVTPAIGGTDPAERLKRPLLFTHDNEQATAGYYAVDLPTVDCLAELTATNHTGVQRYTFDSSKDAHLFLDATSFRTGGRADEGKITILPDAMVIEGSGRVFKTSADTTGGLTGYFVARFSKPFASYATWCDGVSTDGSLEAAGVDAGADINFGNIKGQSVELKIGISFVSLENARENLDVETENLDFEGVRDATRETWEDALSKISIETPDPDIKTIFYTALYHSMIMPTDFTDVNGEYLGFDGQTGTADGFTYRTDMSLWDTFRTEHPLMLLIAPDIQMDSIKSLISMARIDGCLPRWPSESGDTRSMFGTPADLVIAESYLKGMTDFDIEEAYSYIRQTALDPTPDSVSYSDIIAFNEYGYVPADVVSKSVSRTLEFAWGYGSVALLAEALGKTEDAAIFTEKSMAYQNLFDTDTKYFRGRNADGSWQTPFLPRYLTYYDDILSTKFAKAYCEGSARQWRWSVPQDSEGLIELFGQDYFISELNDFMADASKNMGALTPGSGFWIGNEHDMHAPYLFNDAGRPDLTQKWVRWSLAERFSTDATGLDGNDDGGTLSAWYVLSAIGLYPVAGTDRYWIGSPNVDSAVLNLGEGKSLTVMANNQSADNIYVQQVTLNGVKLETPSVTHAQIACGGTMVFTMGPSPAVDGGF